MTSLKQDFGSDLAQCDISEWPEGHLGIKIFQSVIATLEPSVMDHFRDSLDDLSRLFSGAGGVLCSGTETEGIHSYQIQGSWEQLNQTRRLIQQRLVSIGQKQISCESSEVTLDSNRSIKSSCCESLYIASPEEITTVGSKDTVSSNICDAPESSTLTSDTRANNLECVPADFSNDDDCNFESRFPPSDKQNYLANNKDHDSDFCTLGIEAGENMVSLKKMTEISNLDQTGWGDETLRDELIQNAQSDPENCAVSSGDDACLSPHRVTNEQQLSTTKKNEVTLNDASNATTLHDTDRRPYPLEVVKGEALCLACETKFDLNGMVNHLLNSVNCLDKLFKQQKFAGAKEMVEMCFVVADALGKVQRRTCPLCQKRQLSKHRAIVHFVTGSCLFRKKKCAAWNKDQFFRDYEIRKNPDSNSFVCVTCGVTKNSNWRVRQHIEEVHMMRNFSCSHCSKSFATEESLQHHNLKSHGSTTTERTVTCPHCQQEFSSSYLKSHVKLMHSKKVFSCDLCQYKASNSVYLKRHMDSKHAQPKFLCDACGIYFITKQSLARHHKNAHCGEKMKVSAQLKVKCSVCGVLVLQSSLKKHLKSVHKLNPELSVCVQCATTFANVKLLRLHKRTCTAQLQEPMEVSQNDERLQDTVFQQIPNQSPAVSIVKHVLELPEEIVEVQIVHEVPMLDVVEDNVTYN